MKNNLRLLAAFFCLATFLSTPLAKAADIPLLTWEKGKSQSVVLGGGNIDNNWQVFLKSSDAKLIELTPSISNQAGFIVYSLNVPRDISEGAYSVITKGDSSPETLVAAIEIVEMQRYEITRVPGDLLFFLLSLALWFSALAALRGKQFRVVTFLTSTGPKERFLAGEPVEGFIEHVHKLNRFEKLRINIYEQLPDSFFKFLLKSDSRGIHLEFPILWSLLPGISIAVSSVLGYLTRNDLDLSVVGLALVLLISLSFIGSLDIYSGILGAFAFIAVRLWLLPDFSISSIALTTVTSLVFFLPAMISSYFAALVKKAMVSGVYQAMNASIFQWLFPLVFLHSAFLIQRSITGSTQSTLGVEALLAAAVFSGRQIETFLSNSGLKWRKRVRIVEEFEITLGRLMSPSFVFSIFTLLVVIFYSWTLTFSTAITLGLIVTSPLFLLVIRPTWQGLRFLNKVKRNHLVEMLAVVALSIAAFMGVQYLPFVAGTSAIQIVFLGLLPVFLHALISFAADLSERDLKEEAV
jgi:hypothetical protein